MQYIFATKPIFSHHSLMDWHRQQRVRAIEIITYWHGRLNTSDIIAAFGISRIQASKDIKEYTSQFPDNITYSLSDRTYLKNKSFKLHLTKGRIDEYIDHISRMSTNITDIPIERLSLHYRHLKPEVVSHVLQSIKNKKGLSIVYASMSRPEGIERVIYPHSLVDTGYRWHIRAYCDDNQEFRDFNIGRILGIPKLQGVLPKFASRNNDLQWNKTIRFSLIPNPSLSSNQKKVVEVEFGIEKGALIVTTRACLTHYLLQRYQIDSQNLKKPELNQLLAVMNPNVIKPYLFIIRKPLQ